VRAKSVCSRLAVASGQGDGSNSAFEIRGAVTISAVSQVGRRHGVILKVATAVCLVAVTTCLVWLTFARTATNPASEPFTTDPATPTKRPVAVFIGDSYTQGSGKWPGMVAKAQRWEMVNLARGGTGYAARLTGQTAQKGCGLDECPNFVEMADVAIKRKPDVVVVAGGRNDGGVDIADPTHTLFRKVRDALPEARIIAIQPMWDASPYPGFLVGYGRVIRKEVEAVDGDYVKIGNPLAGRPELVKDDGVHPTTAGQEVLAEAINEAMDKT
jgi:acyl-CoA thioesterase-1